MKTIQTKQQGFTLIELTVVIAVLSIIMSVGFYSRTDIETIDRAKEAKLDTVSGAAAAAVYSVQAEWIAEEAENLLLNTATEVNLNGATVATDDTCGLPTLAGLQDAVVLLGNAQNTSNDVFYDPATGIFSLTREDGTALANCNVTYAPNAASCTPTLSHDYSGCSQFGVNAPSDPANLNGAAGTGTGVARGSEQVPE